MNLCVHTVMYLYYALQISPLTPVAVRNALRRVSPAITFLQLAQMLLGLSFTVLSQVFCPLAMWKITVVSLVMYAVYFFEFYKLLMTREVVRKPTTTPKKYN